MGEEIEDEDDEDEDEDEEEDSEEDEVSPFCRDRLTTVLTCLRRMDPSPSRTPLNASKVEQRSKRNASEMHNRPIEIGNGTHETVLRSWWLLPAWLLHGDSYFCTLAFMCGRLTYPRWRQASITDGVALAIITSNNSHRP